MLGIGRDFPALAALDQVDHRRVVRGLDTDFGALFANEAVHRVDLGLSALEHVLPHRGTRAVAAILDVLEQQILDLLQCLLVCEGLAQIC